MKFRNKEHKDHADRLADLRDEVTEVRREIREENKSLGLTKSLNTLKGEISQLEIDRHKKQEDYDKALEVWTALIDRQERAMRALRFDPVPYVEAAKHFEHRAKDFTRALEFTCAAGRRAASTGWRAKSPLRRNLAHRAERLRKRMEQEQGHAS